jgi:hypothetical protein
VIWSQPRASLWVVFEAPRRAGFGFSFGLPLPFGFLRHSLVSAAVLRSLRPAPLLAGDGRRGWWRHSSARIGCHCSSSSNGQRLRSGQPAFTGIHFWTSTVVARIVRLECTGELEWRNLIGFASQGSR